jgi:hypothetical protein
MLLSYSTGNYLEEALFVKFFPSLHRYVSVLMQLKAARLPEENSVRRVGEQVDADEGLVAILLLLREQVAHPKRNRYSKYR